MAHSNLRNVMTKYEMEQLLANFKNNESPEKRASEIISKLKNDPDVLKEFNRQLRNEKLNNISSL